MWSLPFKHLRHTLLSVGFKAPKLPQPGPSPPCRAHSAACPHVLHSLGRVSLRWVLPCTTSTRSRLIGTPMSPFYSKPPRQSPLRTYSCIYPRFLNKLCLNSEVSHVSGCVCVCMRAHAPSTSKQVCYFSMNFPCLVMRGEMVPVSVSPEPRCQK